MAPQVTGKESTCEWRKFIYSDMLEKSFSQEVIRSSTSFRKSTALWGDLSARRIMGTASGMERPLPFTQVFSFDERSFWELHSIIGLCL
jgi:hypothetical protein